MINEQIIHSRRAQHKREAARWLKNDIATLIETFEQKKAEFTTLTEMVEEEEQGIQGVEVAAEHHNDGEDGECMADPLSDPLVIPI